MNPTAPPPDAPRSPRKASLRAKLLLAACSTLAVTIFFEFALRYYYSRSRENLSTLRDYERDSEKEHLAFIDIIRPSGNPRRIYELLPERRGLFWGTHIEISSLGLRDREFSVEPPPDVFRIAVLGDSVTFGSGVSADQTYAKVLESVLNESAGGPRYEVMNFGVPGYNTVMEVETFSSEALKYKPGAVVVQFCWNDFDLPNYIQVRPDFWTPDKSFLLGFILRRASRVLGRDVDPADEPRVRLEVPPVVEMSDELRQSGEFTIRSLRQQLEEPLAYPAYNSFAFIPGEVPEEYRDMDGEQGYRRAMQRLADIMAEHDIPGLQIYFHALYGADQQSPDGRTTYREGIHDWMPQYSSQMGFVVSEPEDFITPYLNENLLTSRHLWVSPGDRHPNPLMHILMAKSIFHKLVTRSMIPDAANWSGDLDRRLEAFDRRAEAARAR